MKILIVILMALVAGCSSKTEHGECIGVNGKKDPTLQYEFSTKNIIIGLIFSETIIVPVIVVMDQLECPISKVKP